MFCSQFQEQENKRKSKRIGWEIPALRAKAAEVFSAKLMKWKQLAKTFQYLGTTPNQHCDCFSLHNHCPCRVHTRLTTAVHASMHLSLAHTSSPPAKSEKVLRSWPPLHLSPDKLARRSVLEDRHRERIQLLDIAQVCTTCRKEHFLPNAESCTSCHGNRSWRHANQLFQAILILFLRCCTDLSVTRNCFSFLEHICPTKNPILSKIKNKKKNRRLSKAYSQFHGQ